MQRRCIVSRPNSPVHSSKVLLQPVRYQEGDGDAVPDGTENRVIVITSGKGGVGKTTASANLGMSIARWVDAERRIFCSEGLTSLGATC